jgi:hypothetical protein
MQQIQILENYGGKRTNNQRILPGVYDVGDPALFGLEDYLVHELKKAVYLEPEPLNSAEVVGTVEALAPIDDDDSGFISPLDAPGSDPTPYDNMTLTQLRAECEKREINWKELSGTAKNGGMAKSDLIYLLDGDDRDQRYEAGLK